MATSAGRAGRRNEDFVAAVPGAVVLLDGAGIPGMEAICAHGVAWYTHRLGGALVGRLTRDDTRDLRTVLADAVDEIAGRHRGTCDLAHPCSPQATVAIVRVRDGRLEHLMLADSYVVVDDAGHPRVLTDEREVAAKRATAAPLDGIPPGTPEFDRVLASCVEELRARRNRPGGYWIAKEDPVAAEHAVTGDHHLDGIDGVALLSNGAARVVSPYEVTDWAGVLGMLGRGGPHEVVRRVRQAETGGDHDAPDDATVAHWTAPR